MPPNLFILAAEDPATLLPILRDTPSLASQQDEHGYSLLHAAASYNHLDLLRTLVNEFKVPVHLRDEDAETALFVVETVAAARVLVEELGIDIGIQGDDALTARQKFELEGDFPAVAEYLAGKEANGVNGTRTALADALGPDAHHDLPLPPQGLRVSLRSVPEEEGVGTAPDPEFRRRIEELAARDDFNTEAGQVAVRRLVEDAVTGQHLAGDP